MGLKQQLDASQTQAIAGMDIPWLLNQWVTRAPDKTFMIWASFEDEQAQEWTYRQFQTQAAQIASGLNKRGVKAGDFVIIHLDNSPEFLLGWFACAMLGAVAVSTNTHSVKRDMTYFAEHVDAVCIITQSSYLPLVIDACSKVGLIVVTDGDQTSQALDFAELLDTSVELMAPTVCTPQANLSVQFTSGTTARPKAVLWTHANGIWGAKVSATHMRLVHDDRTLIFMPMFHTNAQCYSMLATLWVGGTFVLQPKFSASRFWPLSLKYRLTWLSTIPFAFKAIAAQTVPEHQYRFWGTAAHIPALKDKFNVATIGWWGMTETLTHGIVTDVDHPGPHGTIGRAAPEYDIEIRRDDSSLAGPGERGHLFIRGVRGISLFKEYYRNETANLDAFDDEGWFETGDLIRIDQSGNLFFSDRDKDMLKVGAENIAASEIESVVMLSGWVSECAVVAQKHFMLDEVPVAFVIPVSGLALDMDLQEQLLAHCRQNLASFKVPFSIMLVETLPRSTLEKIAKNELRALLPAITE